MATNENNLDAYNEVATTLGGAGGDLNDMVALRAIAVLEGVSGGPTSILDDNMVLRLNAIDVGAGGPGGHLNTLDALNSIVVLKGGVGGHENDLDAINEWVDVAVVLPLDAVTGATIAYSTRKLRSAYVGSALRVRRSSDDAEQDIGFVGIELDTAAMESFCGAGDGFVVTLFDQLGSGDDLVQATASLQPQIVSSGATILRNGKPAIRFDGADDFLRVAIATLNLPVTFFGTITQVTFTNGTAFWDGNSLHTGDLEQITVAPFLRVRATGNIQLVPNLPLLTMGLITAVYNNPNDAMRLNDNSEVTGDITSLNPLGLTLGALGNDAGPIDGEISEFIAYPSALSAGDQTTIRDNTNAFFTIY